MKLCFHCVHVWTKYNMKCGSQFRKFPSLHTLHNALPWQITVVSGKVVRLVPGSPLGIGKKSEHVVEHSSGWEIVAPNLLINKVGFLFCSGSGFQRAAFFLPFCDSL